MAKRPSVKRPSLVLPLLLGVLLLGIGGLAAWFVFGGPPELSVVTASNGGQTKPESPRAAPPSEIVAPASAPAPASPPAEPAAAPEEESERTAVASAGELELASAIWVEGQLVFPENTPLDETVEVIANGKKFKHRDLHRAKVEGNGKFRVAFSKDTKTGRLQIDAPHLYLAETTSLKLSALPSDIVLRPLLGGRIQGVVVPPAGATDAKEVLKDKGVRLFGWSNTTRESVNRGDKLDEALHFDLRGLPPGIDYQIECELPDWAPGRAENVVVAAGADREIELRLQAGARVSGRLVDEAGQPVVDAQLHAQIEVKHGAESRYEHRQGKVAEDGTFAVRGLPAGEVTLNVQKKGCVDAKLELGKLEDGAVKEGVELRVLSGHFVAGRVLWPDGKPVPGATVRAEEIDPDRDNSFYFRDTGDPGFKSDGEGNFRVTGLKDGPFVVTAQGASPPAESAAGAEPESPLQAKLKKRGPKWRAKLDRVAADDAALVLTLQPGFSLAGRVVDDTGAPVTQFLVRATKYDRANAWARSDEGALNKKVLSEDGSFTLEGFQEGEWRLTLRAKGYSDSDSEIVEIPNDALTTIVLARGATLKGTVVDPSGKTVARARVELRQPNSYSYGFGYGNRTDTDLTDAQGQFVIQNAANGALRLVATRDGFAESQPLEITIAAGQTLENLSLALRRGGKLSGELLASGKESVAGRRITLGGSFEDGGWKELHTDATGHFTAEGLTPGRYEVTADPTEQEMQSVSPSDDQQWMVRNSLQKSASVTIVENETTHVVLGAPPRAPVQLSGVVRRGSAPFEGASVLAYRSNSEGRNQQKYAATDEKGVYRMTLDEPGDYSVQVSRSQGGSSISRSVSIPEVASYTLDFDLAVGRISGRVLDPEGDPVSNAQVQLQLDPNQAERRTDGVNGWMNTGDDGTFAFDNLPAGTFTVSATDQQSWGPYRPETRFAGDKRSGIVLEEGADVGDVELRLMRAGTLQGTVRLASGQPAVGALVMLRNERGEPREAWPMVQSDGTGRYRANDLSPGLWTASARLGHDVSAESSPVRISSNEKSELDLSLRPGTMLHVQVVDAQGKPVGAGISVVDERGREHGHSFVYFQQDGNGRTVGPLAPGKYTITASNHDGVTAVESASLHGEEDKTVQLRLGGQQ
jgi:protocatechuate 3,4-dioxygenase beta subunit